MSEDMDLIRYTREHAGKHGHNEYGVPLHACNGYRQDEHYWAWLGHKRAATPQECPNG